MNRRGEMDQYVEKEMLKPKDFYKTHCSCCDKLNSDMLLCGNCKIVRYCDKICQKSIGRNIGSFAVRN